MKLYSILTFCLLVLSISCSGPELNYTLKTIDNVEHITNHFPKYRDNAKITLEHIRTYGKLESGDSNDQLYKPADIVLSKEGNVYIVDAGNFRVCKYDGNGKCVSTFGVQGQGPGELMNPDGIEVDGDGNIYIADGGNVRITRYSHAGEFLASMKLPVISPLRITRSKKIVTMRAHGNAHFRAGFPQKGDMLFNVYDVNGDTIQEFSECRVYDHPAQTGFANKSYFDLKSNDNIVRSYQFRNRIEEYSIDGTLLREYDRNYPFDTGNTHMVSLAIAVDGRERAWTVTVVDDIDIMKLMEGHVYEEFEKRTDVYALDIFSEKGVWLQRIPVERTGFRIRIFGDRLFMIDTFNSMTVDEYRIVG